MTQQPSVPAPVPSPCQEFRTGVVTCYLDGALPAPLVEEVEFHLFTCAECAELLHAHRNLIGLLRVLGGPAG